MLHDKINPLRAKARPLHTETVTRQGGTVTSPEPFCVKKKPLHGIYRYTARQVSYKPKSLHVKKETVTRHAETVTHRTRYTARSSC